MRRTSLVVALAVVVWTAAAEAVVTGQIYGPGRSAFPIAVMSLKDLGGDSGNALGARFARILSRDLELSGYFQLVDPQLFIEKPQSSGLAVDEIDFVGWAAIGAQALVKGGVSATGGQVVVEVRLFDVPGRAEVVQVGKRFTGTPETLPRMAHKIADGILEFLTGERGPFDTAIALVSTRGGLKDVYRFTFDETAPARVTDERSLVVNPRWHPDGRHILFTSYRQHSPRLFQVDVDSHRVALITPGPAVVLDGAWSPDGSQLLVTRETAGNSDVFLLDRAGQVVRRLTDHWAIDVSPAWAPDGRRFAFCSSRAGSPQIYVMNVDGSGLRRVSRTGSYNTSPAWSPKGDRLAYTARVAGGFQVVVSGVDGANGRIITRGGMNENPSWAPDGRYLVYSARRGSKRRLVLTDRDGRTEHELTGGTWDDTSPAWSPRYD